MDLINNRNWTPDQVEKMDADATMAIFQGADYDKSIDEILNL